MNVALLDITSGRKACINKDFMGGYGWAFNAGRGLSSGMINFVKKSGENLPIMSLGYLASIFHQKKWDVEYARNTVPSSKLVIIHSSMVEHKAELEWAGRLKKAGKIVGFTGPFSGSVPEIFLEKCDFVIVGEPEEAVYRISEGLIPKGVLDSRPIEDLNSLPFPKWDIFPHKGYSYFPALREKPFLPILSSRGCPFTCNYCPYLVHYKWRVRSAENVLDEIGHLVSRFGIKSMLFRDPIFTFDRERTSKIAESILERGYKIKWACETRLDRVDKGLLKLMYSAGLRVINVGIESQSEDIIKKASRKPVSLRHQEEMIRYCDEIGIRVTVFYMFGMPDDTRESLLETIRYAKKLNTHVAQFFIFTPFPGTKYYETIKSDIYETDWEKFDCYTPVFYHKNLGKEKIIQLKERAFVSYYYRPAWVIKFFFRAMRDIFNK
ncbi:MAG: radical SAM protein [Omnitrophica bacterium]|nr:radical SAM protein [Candidatus Omnitrophota bacterium]